MRNRSILILLVLILFFSVGNAQLDSINEEFPSENDTNNVDEEIPESTSLEIPPQQYLSRTFILTFAENLFKAKEYEKALLEYMRYRFYFPSDTIIPYIEFRMGLCKENLEEYDAAREIYESLTRRLNPTHQLWDEAYYRYLLTYLLEKKYTELYSKIDLIKKGQIQFPEYTVSYLQSVSLFMEGNFIAAESLLQTASKTSSFLQPSMNYLLSRSKQARYIPQRNPYLAGFLSAFIPGAGQAYSGRWGDAFYSFAGCVGGIGSGLYFWEKDKGFAILTLSFGTILYFGNIYGAINSAILYNTDFINDFISKTERDLPHKPQEIYTGH